MSTDLHATRVIITVMSAPLDEPEGERQAYAAQCVCGWLGRRDRATYAEAESDGVTHESNEEDA